MPFSKILFREKEIKFITNFMEPKCSFPYPALFIYGHTTTGKTLVVSRLVRNLKVPNVWINCHEYYNSSSLCTNIVQALAPEEVNKKGIGNTNEFINFVKSKLKNSSETTYLIFDSADVLRKDQFLLSVLCRLQLLTTVNVCSIFISELPWMQFRTHSCSFDPIVLHFRDYSKNEISDIMTLDCPTGFTDVFYRSYINVILKTFFIMTTNLCELCHLAQINFEKYCEPLDEDSDFELSSFKLWKNIEPTLKEAMNSVYLREISCSKWKAHCNSRNQDAGKNKISLLAAEKYSATRELPFYSKFLLLAAYFASYNAPKSDFKHFVKNQGKQAKKRISKKIEKNRHLLGPKPFTLDRMLSIFFSIVGEKVLPSALIFSQISSLVNMCLVSRVSADEQLDCPKYKCLAELELVAKIGKTINIDIMGYLDDFL
ncbi:origin recognition complex subunit 5 [Nephila pilipes]|uniref:Origin recognition complex subunit 5 n=1 Tax=Nephila pilipes TaxID=299642 RepID=A0A8X6PTU8_NEPPI|nr:origin recognition complex subunit 5 [Nephila pilipes]